MKMSFISVIAFGGALLSTAPAAYAGCGSCGSSYNYGSTGEMADCPPGTSLSSDGTCLMRSSSSYMGSSSYGSSSYSSGSTVTTYGSSFGSSHGSSGNCPAGSSRSADGICLTHGGGSSYSNSSSYSYSSTPLNSYRSHSSYVVDNTITSTMSDHEADYRYGSGSISETYTDGSNTIVPFTTTSATLTNYRVPGMGSNEFLSPTKCPVSVYNPEGAEVLGCYQVSKPAPVRVTVPSYHTVRVVRPVIYVHYPVPTPVPMAMPACRAHHWHSRYGENWPRGCGW